MRSFDAALLCLLAPASALADTGGVIYKARCSLCHAGGGRKVENKLIPASIFEWD
jgi:mono/diheme cytochrome c family protein